MKNLTKISASLLIGASLLSMAGATPVHAASTILPKAVTKVAGTKNYRIYSSIDANGPQGYVGNTKDFKYSHLESKEYFRSAKGTYWHLIVNGRSIGWVNQDFFARNKISVAKSVDLVNNENGKFNTKDAINYATDETGTMINPKKVHASISHLKADQEGEHKVDYNYGKGKASVNIKVRGDSSEGIGQADADNTGEAGSYTTWTGSSKDTSTNWNRAHGYVSETEKNEYSSDNAIPMTLTTRLYQPRFLSLDYGQNDEISQVGVVPEGIAVKDGQLTVSLFDKTSGNYGHLATYNLSKIKSPYAAQNLVSMPYNQFVKYSRNIKVSPYLKLGHGQSVSDSGKYIYVLANTNKYKNSADSDEVLQISKKDLTIKRIWTFKVYNGDSQYPRYFHNVSFVNDHLAYGLFHNATNGTYEYWKIERDGSQWEPTELAETGSELVKNSPVQGFAYDAKNDQFYVGFNDYIFTIDKKGNAIDTQHFDTKRELEGLSVDDGTLYAELTQRAELLKASK